MIDEPYVLAPQVSQVFYVKDVRHKDWTVEVKTKPKEVFDVGIYASHDNDDDDDEVGTYLENEVGTIYDTPLISEDELLEQDFINDEELSNDIYESNDDESNDDKSSDDES